MNELRQFPRAPDNPAQEIWRYTSITKFLSMIVERKLYFSRADKLGDPFEGSLSKPHYEMIRSLAWRSMPRDGICDDPVRREQYEENYRQIANGTVAATKAMYVNCWHANEGESAAMWSVYGKIDESLCVQTTYEKLRSQLPDTVVLGEVNYLDYNVEMTNPNALLRAYQKRRLFSSDQEIRAVIDTSQLQRDFEERLIKSEDAIKISLTNFDFLEKIYINPFAPAWFSLNVLRSILEPFKVLVDVEKSSTADTPLS